jgi:hypothetical protein
MSAVGRWWQHVWFERFDPLAVGVYRIFLGSLITVMFVALYPNWQRFYAADGMLSLHDMGSTWLRPDRWSVFYWSDGIIDSRWYWLLGFIAAVGFTVGWMTRLWTVILYVLQTSMIHRNVSVVNGEDLVFRMLLFYSCFAPLHYSLSVDSWLRSRRRGAAHGHSAILPRIWPVRLIQVNVALVYVIAVLYRLGDQAGEWVRGDAIYWSMMSNMWSRCPWPQLFYGRGGLLLSQVITYSTILIELSFPLLVWFRRPKLYVLAAITCLQLGIAVLIPNVMFFTLAMVCAFWVYVPASTLREWMVTLRMLLDRIHRKFSHQQAGS